MGVLSSGKSWQLLYFSYHSKPTNTPNARVQSDWSLLHLAGVLHATMQPLSSAALRLFRSDFPRKQITRNKVQWGLIYSAKDVVRSTVLIKDHTYCLCLLTFYSILFNLPNIFENTHKKIHMCQKEVSAKKTFGKGSMFTSLFFHFKC